MDAIKEALAQFGQIEKIEVNETQLEIKITGFEAKMIAWLEIMEIILKEYPAYTKIKMSNIDEGIFHIIHTKKQ